MKYAKPDSKGGSRLITVEAPGQVPTLPSRKFSSATNQNVENVLCETAVRFCLHAANVSAIDERHFCAMLCFHSSWIRGGLSGDVPNDVPWLFQNRCQRR